MPNFEFNFLLILPLIGGYLFLTTFYLTKFQHSRIETQRLIFNSIIAALVLTFVCYYIDLYILKTCFSTAREFFKNLIPINYPNLNLFVFVIVFSYSIAKFLNLIPTNILMWYVIERWGDEFEKLYYHSMNATELEQKLLMVTKDDGKVYIGYIHRISKPLLSQQIEIVPFVSGYRKSESKILTLTTPYFKVLNKLLEKEDFEIIDEEMAIVIPKDKIVTLSRFNPKVYRKFQKKKYRPKEN